MSHDEFFDRVGGLKGRRALPNRHGHHREGGTARVSARHRGRRYPVLLARTWCHLSQQVSWPRADAELEWALREFRALMLWLPTRDLVKRVLLRIRDGDRSRAEGEEPRV